MVLCLMEDVLFEDCFLLFEGFVILGVLEELVREDVVFVRLVEVIGILRCYVGILGVGVELIIGEGNCFLEKL